ncbi:MAG: MBG domain-containing protein, partial [Bacteroidales bacterium]|nr:MBG domain-containing protein [Bacteroidales bacterium]
VYMEDNSIFSMLGGTIITDSEDGVYMSCENSTFTMSGGTITGCAVGVYMSGNNSTFTMSGGTITGCDSKGVDISGNNSTFTMTGGEISGCDYYGVFVDKNSTFTMSGGTILGNKRYGVRVSSLSSSFFMLGGSIVGNNGYGVYQSGTFSISGSAVIKDNVKDGTKEGNVYIGGTPSNVYISYSTTFSISGPLDADADIRVDGKLNDIIKINIPEGEGSYQYTASDVAKIHNADGSLIGAIVDGKVRLKKPFGDNITVTATQSATYTGNAIAPTITVSDGNTPLAENTDYTIAYLQGASATTEMINQGEYTIKITAKGDYSGEKNVTFTINPKPITADGIGVAAISAQNYTGKGITPALTITDGSTTLVLGTDYTVTCTDNINIGTATATITGIGNYTGTIEKTFTILPIPVTVTAEAKSKTFGESDPEFTATVTGLVNNDSPDLITYTFSRTEGENAGEYTITPKGDEKQGNYVVSFVDATLTITKATPNPEPDPQNPSTPVSSVDNNGNNVKVWSYAHTIYIASTPDSQYKIIDLQGRTIKSATTKSSYEEVTINTSGVYVVIINGKSYKVSL